ncbi:MAG: ABC transporter permease [Bacillota bacterium]
MVIFQNNIKRLLRDKYTFIMMVLMPVIFISFIMFSVGGNSPVPVTVIDKDNTELTEMLREKLSRNCVLVDADEGEIQRKLLRNRTAYVVVIEEGFTGKLISGENPKLKGYSIKETNVSMAAKTYIEGFMISVKNIAKAAKGDEAAFYKGMEYYNEDSLSAKYETIGKSDGKRSYTAAGIGYLFMFMMYLAVNSTSLILEDKKLKTYGRVLAAPVSTRAYTLQNLISGYFIVFIQVALIMLIMRYMFRADFGPSMFNVFIMLAIFGLTAIALGAMINSFSKDPRQANSMASLLLVPICMLGGCFWPRWLMPDILQQASRFVPTSWALDALEKLLFGRALTDVYLEISILLLFTLVFFLIGSNRKRMGNV